VLCAGVFAAASNIHQCVVGSFKDQRVPIFSPVEFVCICALQGHNNECIVKVIPTGFE